MTSPYPQSTTGFTPGVAVVPSTQVELRISCRDLLDLDITSKSDPMCVVYLKDSYSDKYYEIGRTEVIKNTTKPDFVTPIPMSYNFEEHQKLRFDIYDSDVRGGHLDEQDYLGRMECSLGEIVAAQGTKFTRGLKNKQWGSQGTIKVTAEEIGSCKDILVMQFSATGLDKKDTFGKSDPFLVFAKFNEDNSTTVVHKTEVEKNTLNPTWRTFSIPLRTLCNGDVHRTVNVQCFDWDSDGGSHDLIGEFQTNAQTLMKGPTPENIYQCINPKKKAKKNSYKHSGIVRLMTCRVEKEHSFLDYIQGGTQLHFTVAVDFTASNGDPRAPSSLHFRHSTQPNQYMIAIRAIGEIISDYDHDKMFPALGFGAKLPPDGRVSHEFFLNGNPASPYCPGVDGILTAYYNTLQVVQLYGPTNFSPVINHVARFATAVRDGSAYFVLLIITDGAISDMVDTKRAIIYASSLPMSIIIIGVGGADFSAMEELDADRGGLRVDGQYAQRDIVQFVPMRDFQNQRMTWQQSQAHLAKAVLAEVPRQLVNYMKRNVIQPRAPAAPPATGAVPFSHSAPPSTGGWQPPLPTAPM